MRFFDLPAAAIADRLNQELHAHRVAVVTAPPGAGKSTLLPLTILESLGENGRILMLESRRIAARQIAVRMASMLSEKVGETVGYRMRFESRVSGRTRIEVITEGILTRMLVDDPTLEGVSVVIFDEFHERSLTGDLALALVMESRSLLRPDLRLVIMSATIDAGTICSRLDAPLIESEGRMFPVGIIHSQSDACPENLHEEVARTVLRAHRENSGDILAFLPGEAEIRRCAELLDGELDGTTIYPLYGMLPMEEQRKAISPSGKGERKVVLATPVAETSLTIEGVRIVVDSGFCKKMVFDRKSGLSHLQTVRISMDMAVQRSGRAGRVAEGVCYRLWTPATEARMAECRVPEILEADLAPAVLDISAWGGGKVGGLAWMTPPPPAHVAQAEALLLSLGALDESGNITGKGRRLAGLPCHPRLAGMLSDARTAERKSLAADIAAILEEKDPLQRESCGCSISLRVDEMRRQRASKRPSGAFRRIIDIASQYAGMVSAEEDNGPSDPYSAGALLAAAYPERVGRAAKDGSYMLSGGGFVTLDASDPLAACGWIACASLNARNDGQGTIHLAAPLDPDDISGMLRTVDNISWDQKQGTVVARREKRIGKLVVESRQIPDVSKDVITGIICEAAGKDGMSMFDFASEAVRNLQHRVAAVAQWHPELGLPDISPASVLQRAGEWLPLYIGKAATTAELRKIDLESALWSLLTWDQQQAVDRIAPSHLTVPTGSRIRVEYRQGADAPVLRVRLQECFGMLDTPAVDDGRRPVLMELLSPGFKPVQLTSDLRSFWEGTYFEIRKELRRRYPKHSWPDNPLEAEAVRGVKKRQ